MDEKIDKTCPNCGPNITLIKKWEIGKWKIYCPQCPYEYFEKISHTEADSWK